MDDFEQRLMVSGLMRFRNELLEKEKPTDDVNDLILKVIDAPSSSRTAHRLFSHGCEKRARSVVPPLPTKSDDFAGTHKRDRRRDDREAR